MKKTVIVLICAAVLCAGMCFSACGAGGEVSTDHILADMYNEGKFTRNDIKNIAALMSGRVSVVGSADQSTDDYVVIPFTPKTFNPLPEEIKADIEREFRAENEEYDDAHAILSFEVDGYFGKYGDYYVVHISYELEDLAAPAVCDLIIVSNIFVGYECQDGGEVVVYSENEGILR